MNTLASKAKLSTDFWSLRIGLILLSIVPFGILVARVAYNRDGLTDVFGFIWPHLLLFIGLACLFYWTYKRPQLFFDSDFLYIKKNGQEIEQVPLASIIRLNLKVFFIQKPASYQQYEISFAGSTGFEEKVNLYFHINSRGIIKKFIEEVRSANPDVAVKDWAHSLEKWM